MSRLRDILTERYLEHYSSLNITVNPVEASRYSAHLMQVMYDEFITGLPPRSQVLDLGCGTGLLLYWLSKKNGIIPIGVDNSPAQVEVARDNLPEIAIHCDDGLAFLRRYANVFAGIFCIDVLEHIPGDDLCLEWVEAAYDALLPGGFLLCRAPNAANLTGAYSRYIDLTHTRIFTSRSIVQLLDAGGFRDARVIPQRTASWRGRFRLGLEKLLHRVVFRITDRGTEQVFTKNLYAVGFKSPS